MKALRIAQVVLLVLAAIYLLLFHNLNRDYVRMPGFLSMAPAFLVALTAVIGWFVGWLPGRLRAWQLQRKLHRTEADRDLLAKEVERLQRVEPSQPIIPDRVAAGVAQGEDPTDYL